MIDEVCRAYEDAACAYERGAGRAKSADAQQFKEALKARCAALQTANDLLQIDAMRLDQLEASRYDVTDEKVVGDEGEIEYTLVCHGWGVRGQCETVREAIDVDGAS